MRCPGTYLVRWTVVEHAVVEGLAELKPGCEVDANVE
jgi:hypothetical protein